MPSSLKLLHGLIVADPVHKAGIIPANANITPDYPDGFQYRCKRADWIETATKGAGRGEFRWAHATSDERHSRPDYWRKPKTSMYVVVLVLYLVDDVSAENHGHIERDSLHWTESPVKFDAFFDMWGDQFDDQQRAMFETGKAIARKYSRREWEEHEAGKRAVLGALAAPSVN